MSETEIKFYPPPGEMIYKDPKSGRLDSVAPYYQPYLYQPSVDVGQDINLQNNVAIFFHTKILKWIDINPDFKHLKKYNNFLKSEKGIKYIKTLLKLFVRNSRANWYDLRDEYNYPIVKKYLNHKIGNI